MNFEQKCSAPSAVLKKYSKINHTHVLGFHETTCEKYYTHMFKDIRGSITNHIKSDMGISSILNGTVVYRVQTDTFIA